MKKTTTNNQRPRTILDFVPTFFTYFDEIIVERQIHAIVLVFHGPASGEIIIQPSEVIESGWFTFAQALELPLAFHHNQIIGAYMDRIGLDV